MIKFNVCELSIKNVITRFYLMMAVVIFAGFIGQWWLAILALPIFFSAVLGIQIKTGTIAS